MKKIKICFFWNILLIVLFSFFFISILSCTIVKLHLEIKENDLQSLQKNIYYIYNELYNKVKSGAISISIVDQNNILFSDAFGYKDFENGIKAKKNTGFRIGSISKIFTAIAIMQLYEKGLIDINAPIKKYIPEFNIKSRYDNDKEITIKSIMNHHSGLPSDYYSEFFKIYDGKEELNLNILFGLLKDEYKPYPTDYIFSYSNLGVSILGEIIQRVSKMEFNKYIEENIFKPLEMKNSSFYIDEKTKNIIANGYSKRKLMPYYSIRDIPAGNMISTSSDMANFMIMLLNKGKYKDKLILSEKYFDMMIKKTNEGNILDGDINVGLNFFLNNFSFNYYDYDNYLHDGYIPPFFSRFVIFNGQKIGLFYSFSDDIYADQNYIKYFNNAVDKTLELIFQYKGNTLENLKRRYENNFNKTFAPFNYFYKPKNIEKIKIDKEKEKVIDKILGDYFTLIGKMSIYKKNNKILMSFQNNLLVLSPVIFQENSSKNINHFNLNEGILFKADLLIFGGISLSGDKAGVPFFKIIEKDNIYYISVCYPSDDKIYCDTVVGRKFEKKEIPETIKNYLGEYEQENENKEAKLFFSVSADKKNVLKLEDGFLIFSFNFLGNDFLFYLYPIKENEFIVMGAGRMAMDTVFIYEKEGKKILRWSGIEFIKK